MQESQTRVHSFTRQERVMMRRCLLGFSGIPHCSIFPFPSLYLFSLLWHWSLPLRSSKIRDSLMASSQASQVHSVSSSPSTTLLPETVLQASPCQRLTENKAVMDVVIEARSLYQVAAPMLSTTAAGDVTFVGMPSGSRPRYSWGESNLCEGTKGSLATVG